METNLSLLLTLQLKSRQRFKSPITETRARLKTWSCPRSTFASIQRARGSTCQRAQLHAKTIHMPPPPPPPYVHIFIDHFNISSFWIINKKKNAMQTLPTWTTTTSQTINKRMHGSKQAN